MIKIIRTNSDNQDFIELVKNLDADLAERDGNDHSFYHQFNTIDKIKHAVIAYEDNKLVGCGAIKEFQYSPYKSRCFTKYNITSYGPQTGVIQAAVGDTIRLFVQINVAPGRNIGGGSINDTSVWPPLPAAIYCKPATINKNIIDYSYVVQSRDTQWLQLVYNDDMILRYRLDIKVKKEQ